MSQGLSVALTGATIMATTVMLLLVPNTNVCQFPEINFAAQVDDEVVATLKQLSNATTEQVIDKLVDVDIMVDRVATGE